LGEIEFRAIAWAAAIVEFGGTLVIVAHAAAALVGLALGRLTLDGARRVVAEGAVSGLSWKLSAALLKTVELQTFDQIGVAFAILALRHLIAFALAADRRRSDGGGD
jgi:hypothetical protein